MSGRITPASGWSSRSSTCSRRPPRTGGGATRCRPRGGERGSGVGGGASMLAVLSEALFVDTVRRYVANLPDQTTGWLAGARDPVVGKSLALLHRRAHHAWTVSELASEVGVSRSALMARFTRYLSDPPMAYLTGWRLR